MTYILTLITNPAHPALDSGTIAGIADKLSGAGAQVGHYSWLASGVAADIPLSDITPDVARPLVAEAVREQLIDFAIQPVVDRRKKLLIADMDSTIIEVECIDELADFAGLKPKISAITEAAMRGELDFVSALKERVALLEGMDEGILQSAYDERVTLMPGARELIATMNAHGAKTVLVSGGFTFFTSRVSNEIGFQVNRANVLEVVGGRLSGKVLEPIVDSATKLESLKEFAAKADIDLALTLAVGDGANDIPMIAAAGLGVAYRAKPKTAAAADVSIRHSDLTALLYLQGYTSEEIVNR